MDERFKFVKLKKLLKRLFLGIITLILLLLISLAVIKFKVGPNVIRQKLLSYISNIWAGQVNIEGVKFSLFKPLYVKRVSLLDLEGREWAYAESVEFTLENWPSLKMKLEQTSAVSLTLMLHIEEQGAGTLFKIASEETDGVKNITNVPSFVVQDISINLVDGKRSEPVLSSISFSSQQNDDLYEISVVTKHPDKAERFEAYGTINLETMQIDASLDISHQLKIDESIALISLLSDSDDYSGEGHVTSNVKMSGSLKDLNSIQPEGTIELTGFSLSYKEYESVAKSINSIILFSKNNISSKYISAVMYEGCVDGSFNIDYNRFGPSESSGEFKVKELQLAELAKDFEGLGNAGKGTVEVEYIFSATSQDPHSLNGHGYIQLKDSDLFAKPIISNIFKLIGLKDQHLTERTDAACVFTNTGSAVTIKKAEATSKYGAIVVEPGGTVDLKKNWIDIYVIAVPVKALRGLLEKIPFVSIITAPTDKLTRFQIVGNMSDPPIKLIKKQPFKDVAASIFTFFKEVIDTGGNLSKTTIDSTHNLFETLAGRNDKK